MAPRHAKIHRSGCGGVYPLILLYRELGLAPFDFAEDVWWHFYLSEGTLDFRKTVISAFSSIAVEPVGEYVEDRGCQVILVDRETNTQLFMVCATGGHSVSANLYLGMRRSEFGELGSQDDRCATDRYLEYGKLCYRAATPLYGCGQSFAGSTDVLSILKGELLQLRWAQFWPASLVRRLGREVLIQAPAWRNENLNDGGLLYVLSATAAGAGRGPRQCWRQARDYLFQHLSIPVVLPFPDTA